MLSTWYGCGKSVLLRLAVRTCDERIRRGFSKDARREELYCGTYERGTEEWKGR